MNFSTARTRRSALWHGTFHVCVGASFVAVYFSSGIYWATAVTMLAVTVEMLVVKLLLRHTASAVEVSGVALVLGLGTFTLIFHDATYVEMRPTVVYWVIAAGLTLARVLRRRDPLEVLLGRWVSTSNRVWTALRRAATAVLVTLGAVNIAVSVYASTDIWMVWRLAAAYVVLPLTAAGLFVRHRRSIVRHQRATPGRT